MKNLDKDSPLVLRVILIVFTAILASPVLGILVQFLLDKEKVTVKTETYIDGSFYKGEIQNQLRHGRGTYKLANGDQYEGQWLNDQYHGMGVYTWSNGDQYAGQWLNGLKHGKGVWKSFDGKIKEGIWKNDRLVGY